MMVKLGYFVILIFLGYTSVSFATGIPSIPDSQQPTLMLVPLKNFVDFGSIGIEGGNAQQELLFEDGSRHTDNSTTTYSVLLGRKLGDNLIVGARLGPVGVPLLLLNLHLNIQYDVVKNDFCKFSVSAMFGGFDPGPRYGAGVLASCFFKAWQTTGAVFLSYQSLVDKKQFQISDSDGAVNSDFNSIEADLKYNIALLGVEYIIPIEGIRNLSMLLSVGLQTVTESKVTYEEYVPSGYAIGNGNWSALEFRVYFP